MSYKSSLILFISLFITVITGCKKQDIVANYFPGFNVGDTSRWNYYQAPPDDETENYMTLSGTMIWNIISISNYGGIKTCNVQMIYTGEWYLYPGGSGYMNADTGYFKIMEYADSITYMLGTTTKFTQYYGTTFTLKRNYPSNSGDEITIQLVNAVATIKQNIGLIKFETTSVGMSAKPFTYTRIL